MRGEERGEGRGEGRGGERMEEQPTYILHCCQYLIIIRHTHIHTHTHTHTHTQTDRQPTTSQHTILLVPHADNDLGGPVVAGDDVGCHHEGGVSSSGQPKVKDLQTTVLLHHNVARFEVLRGRGWWEGTG